MGYQLPASRLWSWSWLIMLPGIWACSSTSVQTPTRSLDRPTDIAMVCAVPTDDRGTLMMPLNWCNEDNFVDGGVPQNDGGVTNPGQLFLLATNTSRGEVALIAADETNLGPIVGYAGSEAIRKFYVGGAAIINLDLSQPGYGFLPVGDMPEHIRSSSDGCLAVTTNVDSCDLAVIDVARLLRIQTGETAPTTFIASVARRIQPKIPGTGRPLYARPTWLEFTSEPGITPGNLCSNETSYHAYVSFPSCELVAEIDLATGELLQALKVTRNGAFAIDPAQVSCPVECTGLPLDGGIPPAPDAATQDAATSDAAAQDASTHDAATGLSSAADGGLPPILPTTQAFPKSLALDQERQRLFIADLTGANITIVQLDAEGGFGAASRITLTGAPEGVEVIRLLPRLMESAENSDPGIRYLYAMARDRTVRVVDIDRNLECETNPEGHALNALYPLVDSNNKVIADPLQVQRAMRCMPVGAPSTPPRSPLSLSPGIALPGHSLPRDIGFVHIAPPLPVEIGTGIMATPSLTVGDFAWIVDTAGRIIALNLYDQCPQPNDPAQGSNPLQSCLPGTFAPSVQEFLVNPGAPVPLAIDLMPNRIRSGNARFQTVAYNDPTGAPRLGDLPTVSDDDGTLDPFATDHTYVCNIPVGGSGIPPVGCTNPPLSITATDLGLIAFRDPSLVRNENWTLAWESTIPGTVRAGGSVLGANLLDQGASFCTQGAQAGDKAVILGCSEDSDCGLTQLCYHDPGAPNSSRGLCLANSSNTFEQAISVCTPWTRSLRRYQVVEASQNQLTLDEIYEPEYEVDTHACISDTDCSDVVISALVNVTIMQLPTSCLDNGHGAKRCLRSCNPDALGSDGTCGEGFTCTRSRLGDNRCSSGALPPTNPTLRNLCFSELQVYEIHAGNSFFSMGDVSGALGGGYADPATGACTHASDDSNRLLWPRIALDAPPCPSSVNDFDWLAPLPSGTPNSCRLSLPGSTTIFLRYSNPIFDIVIAVPPTFAITSNDGGMGLDAGISGPLLHSPPENTLIALSILGGFHSLYYTLGVDITAQLPRTTVVGPNQRDIYVVDDGKQNDATGLRGQIIRFLSDIQMSDSNFIIR